MSITQQVEALRQIVAQNLDRVAQLGQWPGYINKEQSLLGRIPEPGETGPGFDAGLACCLGLIPPDKQKLAACLHAAYSQEAVEQVRKELELDNADFRNTETFWWLAACFICDEGGVSQEAFLNQIETFKGMDLLELTTAARVTFSRMQNRYQVLPDGVVYVKEDGGLQGAYLDGHDWGVQWEANYGIWFIGTFLPSLGLEEFKWSDHKDEKGRPLSGPVHGSKQFIKAATLDELVQAIGVVKQKLGVKK